MTHRMAKKRNLQKAGFAYVAGWVEEHDATTVEKLIEAAKPKVQEVLEGGANEDRG